MRNSTALAIVVTIIIYGVCLVLFIMDEDADEQGTINTIIANTDTATGGIKVGDLHRQYDQRGNVTRFSNLRGYWWEAEYDQRNNIVRFRNSYGYESHKVYDLDNTLVQERDNMGYDYHIDRGFTDE